MEKALTDIKALVGLPYKKRCYDLSGFDCWSLAYHIYQLNNIEVPQVILDKWSIREQHRRFQAGKTNWKQVEFQDREYLDILLFHTSRRLLTHVAVTIDKKWFIHASSTIGVVMERFSSGIQASLIHKVYRWQQ